MDRDPRKRRRIDKVTIEVGTVVARGQVELGATAAALPPRPATAPPPRPAASAYTTVFDAVPPVVATPLSLLEVVDVTPEQFSIELQRRAQSLKIPRPFVEKFERLYQRMWDAGHFHVPEARFQEDMALLDNFIDMFMEETEHTALQYNKLRPR